ncbi:MAG: hypothetical protein ACKO34_08815, partial [Vampirovibrionales bacterium]
ASLPQIKITQETLEKWSRLDVPETSKNLAQRISENPFPSIQLASAVAGWTDLMFFKQLPLFYVTNALCTGSGFMNNADLALKAFRAGNPELKGVEPKDKVLKAVQNLAKPANLLNPLLWPEQLRNYIEGYLKGDQKLWHDVTNTAEYPNLPKLPSYLHKSIDAFGQPSIVFAQTTNNLALAALITMPSSFLGEIGRISSTMFGGFFSAGAENKYRIEAMQKTGVVDPLAHFADIYHLSKPIFYKHLLTGSITNDEKQHLANFKQIMKLDLQRNTRHALGLLLPIDFKAPVVHKAHYDIEYLQHNGVFTPAGFNALKERWLDIARLVGGKEGYAFIKDNSSKYSLWGLSGFLSLGFGGCGIAYPILEYLGQRQQNKTNPIHKVKVGVDPYGRNRHTKTEGSTQEVPENDKLRASHQLRKATNVMAGLSRLAFYGGSLFFYMEQNKPEQVAAAAGKIALSFGQTSRWAYWKNHVLNAVMGLEYNNINKNKGKPLFVFKPAVQKVEQALQSPLNPHTT